jgi:hypothetical protein
MAAEQSSDPAGSDKRVGVRRVAILNGPNPISPRV